MAPPSTVPTFGPDGKEGEFLAGLPEYIPTIPDDLTKYYLERSGFAEPDVVLTRLVSLAAQKFVAGIAEEAHWYCEQRQQSTAKSRVEQGYDVRDKRKVLTTEDLAAAMKEHGVNIKKPVYFADNMPGGSGKKSGQ